MTDNNKKRSSFRKIFPILFFSSKGKQKSIKDTHSSAKANANSSTSRDNPYQNPRSIIERYENRIENTDENDERIYENLSTVSPIQNISESNNTSSSTLVSENVINRHHQNVDGATVADEQREFKYIARPQVPPRPQNEISYSSPVHYTQNNIKSNQYPDVYYHSLEKLEDNISPIDEIEIYKASRAQIQPASVGAEIKKVSTKFLISPKKEAEVRKMQPTRARSLSLDKKKPTNIDHARNEGTTYKTVEKPYNYSAPTSPVAVNHKIPNMPATVSPYEHVRKTMIEAEERRNSLSRSNSRNKSTPSPMPFCSTNTLSHDVTASSLEGDTIKKEKTRKRVEAFYWQKIKEMKLKEDEYLLRQSLNNSMRVPRTNLASYSNSNCSTPISFITDSRTSSLPRGREINQTPSPFTRGALERRTDSFINTKTVRTEPQIVYRHPEKLQAIASKPNLPIFQRGSLTCDTRNVLQQQAKRVSFEEQPNFKKTIFFNPDTRNSEPLTLVASKDLRNPPRPPVRTSSAVSANKHIRILPNNKHKVVGGPRFFCSESESGSEAGEIQRIMQSNGRKGHTVSKTWVDTKVKIKKQAFLEGLSISALNPSSKGRRLIIIHIGNENGFIEGGENIFECKNTGDYHESMDATNFEQ